MELDNLEYLLDCLKNNTDRSGKADLKNINYLNMLKLVPYKIAYSKKAYTFSGWSFDPENRIAGIPEGSRNNTVSTDLSYNEGCSKDRLKQYEGIFLTTGYNYKMAENKLLANGGIIKKDIKYRTYGARSLAGLESLRLKAADCIKRADEFIPKVCYLAGFGKHIADGVKETAERDIAEKGVKNCVIRSAAERMIKDGCSFRQIIYCLNADPYFICKLAEDINLPFKLSPEEESLYKEAENKAQNEAAEQKKVSDMNAGETHEKFNRAFL